MPIYTCIYTYMMSGEVYIAVVIVVVMAMAIVRCIDTRDIHYTIKGSI